MGCAPISTRLLEAIDERTALVAVSLVLFKSAFIENAAAIVEKAHRVGARVILDVYQAAGTFRSILNPSAWISPSADR